MNAHDIAEKYHLQLGTERREQLAADIRVELGLVRQEYAEAIAAEREACCRDVCPHCKDGNPVRTVASGRYVHSDNAYVCRATAIRARGQADE